MIQIKAEHFALEHVPVHLHSSTCQINVPAGPVSGCGQETLGGGEEEDTGQLYPSRTTRTIEDSGVSAPIDLLRALTSQRAVRLCLTLPRALTH